MISAAGLGGFMEQQAVQQQAVQQQAVQQQAVQQKSSWLIILDWADLIDLIDSIIVSCFMVIAQI